MSDNKTANWRKDHQGAFRESSAMELNRGLFYGDGLFETMVFKEGQIRFRSAHEERLHDGLATLKMKAKSLSNLKEIESLLLETYGRESRLRVRWTIYRSGTGRYTPETNMTEETLLIEKSILPNPIKNRAFIHPRIRLTSSPWSHCKTLNALPYVMANIDRKEKGYDEVILLDDQGRVSEAGSSNLFWRKGEAFFTPSLDCNGIAGVSRRMIIEQLRHDKIDLTEGEFLPDDLKEADQLFTSNVSGISYIAHLSGQNYDTQPIKSITDLFG